MVTPVQWGIYHASLDPSRGSEQGGYRPVLVVSGDTFHQALPIAAIVPLTSHKPGRSVYPTMVAMPKGVAGLPKDSLVLAHQLRTVSRDRLERLYGVVADEAVREAVREAIRIYLDLE